MQENHFYYAATLVPEHHIFAQSGVTADQSLKFAVLELGIRDIRLGIRWSEVWREGSVDLEPYKRLLDLAGELEVNLCLNLGPIKTARWPEDQVPEIILAELNEVGAGSTTAVPTKRATIELNSELAQRSISYLAELMQLLEPYSSITGLIQLNNEGFHHFGEHEWLMSPEFEREVLSLTRKSFPNQNYLFNSSGRRDLRKILKFAEFAELHWEKLVVGLNYYYKVPFQATNPILKHFDNLQLALPWQLSTGHLRKLSKKRGFRLEVTELQAEPWDEITSPGNNFEEFDRASSRCQRAIGSGALRIWGLEELAVKFLTDIDTEEHHQIKNQILSANTK